MERSELMNTGVSTSVIEQWETLSVMSSFIELGRQINNIIHCDFLIFASVDLTQNKALTFCFLHHAEVLDNICYNLGGTPCQQVTTNNVCLYNGGAAKQFPDDEMLAQYGIETYVGFPLRTDEGDVIGIMAALFRDKKQEFENTLDVFRVLSSAISSKMQSIIRQGALVSVIKENENQQALLHCVFDVLPDAIITINQHGIIQGANQSVSRMFGYATDELPGANISLLMPSHHAQKHNDDIANYLANREPKLIGQSRKLQARRKDGSEFDMELFVAPVEHDDGMYFVGYIRDISETTQLKKLLFNAESVYRLSGLPNRVRFRADLPNVSKMAELTGKRIYAAALRIDRYQQLFSELGENASRELIIELASQLKGILPECLKLYHCEEHRFLLLGNTVFSSVDESELQKIEHQILGMSGVVIKSTGTIAPCTLSVGRLFVEPLKIKGADLENLCNRALHITRDKRLNGIHCLSYIDIDAFESENNIRTYLHSAITKGEIVFDAQPKVGPDGHIVSAELLARWYSPVLGTVSPFHFIPIAEEGPEIMRISIAMLDSAGQFLSWAKHEGVNIRLAVNISPRFLMHSTFLQLLNDCVNQYDIAPDNLILEVTESLLISDVRYVKRIMHEARSTGFKWAIDDFGTGYSSLLYLSELPISEVKIDKGFVDKLGTNEASSAQFIIDSVISLSHSLGACSVAEGVETDAQFSTLKELGCTSFQGYLFHKPMKTEALKQLLKP